LQSCIAVTCVDVYVRFKVKRPKDKILVKFHRPGNPGFQLVSN